MSSAEIKKYKKSSLLEAVKIGRALVREFKPERTNYQDQPLKQAIHMEKAKPESMAERKSLVKECFYQPYVEERLKMTELLADENIDITAHPVHAAFVSLIAASQAANSAIAMGLAENYVFEFSLPEQYVLSDTAIQNDMGTKRVALIPETRELGAEIVQAWMLVDYYGAANEVGEKFSIPHNSLRATRCSFMTTCAGTDLTFEDIGVSTHDPTSDLIGDRLNYIELTCSDKGRPTEEVIAQVANSFMTRVQSWQ